MIEREHKCPQCSGTMEEGYVLDKTYGGFTQEAWADGKPERSIWTGLKLSNHVKIDVTTERCKDCGYLESYALP